MDKEKLELLKGLYKPPFRYDPEGQNIFDAKGEPVLDIRGWGRMQYLPNGEAKQDAFGEYVAELLNTYFGSEYVHSVSNHIVLIDKDQGSGDLSAAFVDITPVAVGKDLPEVLTNLASATQAYLDHKENGTT